MYEIYDFICHMTVGLVLLLTVYGLLELYRAKDQEFDEDSICCQTCKHYDHKIHECPLHIATQYADPTTYYCDDWDSKICFDEEGEI